MSDQLKGITSIIWAHESSGLAAGILVGLVLNAAFGWWWADIAAGAILVAYGLREGREHLRRTS